MITIQQRRDADVAFAARIVHFLMDNPDLEAVIARNRERDRLKAQREQMIAKDYERGEKVEVIMREYRCTHRTIKNACERNGVRLRINEKKTTK